MENRFIRVDEVAQELSVSKPYAYKLIRKLNDELKDRGFITIAGRVNRQYFMKGSTGLKIPQGRPICPVWQYKNREGRGDRCLYSKMRAAEHGM